MSRYWSLWLPLLLFWLLPACHVGAAETARLGVYTKIIRDLNQADTRAALEVWSAELTRKFQVPSEVRFFDDISVLRREFEADRVNFVIADAMSLVRHFKPEEFADGFTTQLTHDASLLLMARSNSVGKLDLAGKKVVLLARDEISSTYLETLCLRLHGRPCAGLLGEAREAPNNHQAITRLFFGQTDLALVNRHGLELAKELNPQLAGSGEVVERMEFATQFFGFFKSTVSPDFRRHALRTIPHTHMEPRGRQLLEVFRTEKLALADTSALKPFYRLEREYRELQARAGRREGRK